MFSTKIKILFLFIATTLSSLSAQMTISKLDSMAVFSFSIMSDNKGYSVENPDMYKCDKWIREAGDRFILGLGDHVKDNRKNPFLDLIKNDTLWHNHFYPNVADGENEYWGTGQGDWGAGAPILNYVDLSKRKNVKIRKNKCEYYAVEEYDGIKVHIIQLHYSDTPTDPAIAFNESTRKYLFDTLDSIDKTDNDIIVVLAHTGPWVNQLSEERKLKLMNKADLVLGATTHRYKRYYFLGEDVDTGAIAFNTGSVGNSPTYNGFLQVHVFKNPTRMIVQYQETKNDTRKLQGEGFAYEKVINGKISDIDWNTFLAKESGWNGPSPHIVKQLQTIADKFKKYSVVLKPDKDEAEYWAGAPSVVRDEDGIFWMAARMRSPEYPRGLRGYEIRILKSEDGIHFNKYHSIFREDVPIPGFERPALLIDPVTKKFKLYACGPWQQGPWSIIKFNDVSDLKDIDPTSAHPVIVPPVKQYARDVSVKEYKDPVIIFAEGKYHCYVTGYIRRNERLFHFVSDDGENWDPVGNVNQPIMDLDNWHNFFIRPASVLPLGIGYLFIYEGSSTQWYDPVYNLGTGFGFTFDLHNIIDLTTESPLLLSTTPGKFYTFRYSDWIWVNGELWIYAEVAKKNNSHEIRLTRISIE
ncbi:hypothetical protein MNBD_IGNAVI01-1970 [hydrothermal vent metagenome]|uniref:Calcineurin-like phosphoesterase domain-containing protein n=1 Tax=hydrothermal vent metagenome TaxID=652676 RepID=A0A3B1C323_9ZZZZ